MTASVVISTLAAAGVELFAREGRLRFRALPEAYTPDLRALVDEHRPELLAHLTSRCRRCGPAGYRDVPIHDGRSVRRDCAKCGLFIDFPVWNPQNDSTDRCGSQQPAAA